MNYNILQNKYLNWLRCKFIFLCQTSNIPREARRFSSSANRHLFEMVRQAVLRGNRDGGSRTPSFTINVIIESQTKAFRFERASEKLCAHSEREHHITEVLNTVVHGAVGRTEFRRLLRSGWKAILLRLTAIHAMQCASSVHHLRLPLCLLMWLWYDLDSNEIHAAVSSYII